MKHIVPNVLYYILLFVGIGGMVQIYFGTYMWGRTLEQNIFIITSFGAMIIIIIDSIVQSLKYKIKIIN